MENIETKLCPYVGKCLYQEKDNPNCNSTYLDCDLYNKYQEQKILGECNKAVRDGTYALDSAQKPKTEVPRNFYFGKKFFKAVFGRRK
ncbi:MAG: hypothetical protein ACP5OG_04035 [Candidatus Nanoarchaeia archaeon]